MKNIAPNIFLDIKKIYDFFKKSIDKQIKKIYNKQCKLNAGVVQW